MVAKGHLNLSAFLNYAAHGSSIWEDPKIICIFQYTHRYCLEAHILIFESSRFRWSSNFLLQSFASHDLYEFYTFDFYLEQILEDEDHVETRLRSHRMLTTPLLPRPVFTENQTDPEERTFSVYLGDVPEDVELAALHLNGYEFSMLTSNSSMYTISKVFYFNNTYGYSLTVPFDDPVVIHEVPFAT